MELLELIAYTESEKDNLHIAKSIALKISEKVKDLAETVKVADSVCGWELGNIYCHLLEVDSLADYNEKAKTSTILKMNTPNFQLIQCIQELAKWAYNNDIDILK